MNRNRSAFFDGAAEDTCSSSTVDFRMIEDDEDDAADDGEPYEVETCPDLTTTGTTKASLVVILLDASKRERAMLSFIVVVLLW